MRRYVRFLASWLLFWLLAVIAINYTIDPYGIFGTVAINGLNEIKARAGQRTTILARKSDSTRSIPPGLQTRYPCLTWRVQERDRERPQSFWSMHWRWDLSDTY